MTAEQRRQEILTLLEQTDTPLSAAALAHRFSVSRQIVVGDVALLRAQGREIVATARGYVIPSPAGLVRQVACRHTAAQTREELDAMVDCGCTVIDVVVEHPGLRPADGAAADCQPLRRGAVPAADGEPRRSAALNADGRDPPAHALVPRRGGVFPAARAAAGAGHARGLNCPLTNEKRSV